MGKMKEIFMEIRNEEGNVPDDFSLAEYMLKKEMEYAELKEIEERLAREQESTDDKSSQGESDICEQSEESGDS